MNIGPHSHRSAEAYWMIVFLLTVPRSYNLGSKLNIVHYTVIQSSTDQ